uniref:Fatty acid synthase type I helical domain-containing protein n=1 Tax=Hyaloperonospora arabidopsidis (strain Emoy2) TaxID=559515 RepID=M4C0L0_HYAAE
MTVQVERFSVEDHSARMNGASEVSKWVAEHGEFYGAGIAGKFGTKKERQLDSYWKWAVQDAMELY